MNLFSFGKRRVRRSVKKTRKPPARLLKMCKKYRIKTTKKVGRKRVYRSITVLKKLLRKKMKKVKGTRKVPRKRRSGFGKESGCKTGDVQCIKAFFENSKQGKTENELRELVGFMKTDYGDDIVEKIPELNPYSSCPTDMRYKKSMGCVSRKGMYSYPLAKEDYKCKLAGYKYASKNDTSGRITCMSFGTLR